MIYSNPVNIEIAMRWERPGGMQVSLDVDEETGVKRYAWEFGKEAHGIRYLVIEGDAGRVFISEKLCKMISTFLKCAGNHESLSGQLQAHQEIASMFAPAKADVSNQEKLCVKGKPGEKDTSSKNTSDANRET